NVVGQSGTASPTFLLVTIPPLQMSKSVATHVSHAKRLSHLVEIAEGIQIKLTAEKRISQIICGRRLAGDVRASHSEAATADPDFAQVGPAAVQVCRRLEVVCFAAAAVPPATRPVARRQRARRALSATPHNPGACPPRACPSFRNGPSRKAGRRSLRRSRS